MDEGAIFVFGAILGTGIIAYLLLGGGGFFSMGIPAKDIATYAGIAGFSGDDLVIAVAIALAESGGDPKAQGDNFGGEYTSYGLWQIHWTVHPEFDASQLFDPQYNANAAYLLYARRGNRFIDWSTYTQTDPKTGQPPYISHLVQAGQGVNA